MAKLCHHVAPHSGRNRAYSATREVINVNDFYVVPESEKICIDREQETLFCLSIGHVQLCLQCRQTIKLSER
jgi:hypothetical protein